MLLTTLNKTKQLSAGKLPWINEMIVAREKLIISYFILLTPAISEADNIDDKVNPSYDQIKDFCGLLVDYLSRGHFEIYPKILTIMEHVSSRRLTIARRLVPRIQDNTELLLKFSDKYSNQLDEGLLKNLKKDLAKVGQLLENRFSHEDRMVIALQIMDNTISAATNSNVSTPA